MEKTIYGELTDQQGKTVKLVGATTDKPLSWLVCSEGLTPLLTVEHARELKRALDNFIKTA